MQTIELTHLAAVVGGTSIEDIKKEARPWCPNTVKRYDKVDPSTIDRSDAERMGQECLAEINPFFRGAARSKIRAGIDAAFPK